MSAVSTENHRHASRAGLAFADYGLFSGDIVQWLHSLGFRSRRPPLESSVVIRKNSPLTALDDVLSK